MAMLETPIAAGLPADAPVATPAPPPWHARPALREEWRKVLATGEAGVVKRLSWGDPPRAENADLRDQREPRWRRLLRSAYGDSPEEGDGPAEVRDRALRTEQPLPFEELYLPLVRHGRAAVRRGAGLAYRLLPPGGHAALERQLLLRVATILSRALLAEFSVYRACQPPWLALTLGGASAYGAFRASQAADRLEGFFLAYPVAARLAATVTWLWIEATCELLQRLARDLPDIQTALFAGRALGAVVRADPADADPHDGGRSVVILEFEGGERLVYKPRPLDLEEAFGSLTDFVNAAGTLPRLRRTRTLARGDYGWSEFVEATACADTKEVERFHTRCGVLLALAYALGGHDFHFENVIAAGEHPVLIDLEAMLQPRLSPEALGSPGRIPDSLPKEALERSVLSVGLLPWLRTAAAGVAVNLGGIDGARPSGPLPIWRFEGVNHDHMRVQQGALMLAGGAGNRVRLGEDSVQTLPYVPCILDGFTRAYRFLLEKRAELLAPGGPLTAFRRARLRFIFRDTNLYATLLQRTLHPRFLRTELERHVQLDALARVLLSAPERPPVWPILAAEVEALDRMDVPLFQARADSRSLALGGGRVLSRCFVRSAYEEIVDRVRRLDDADLARQRMLVSASFQADRERALTGLPGRSGPARVAPHWAEGDAAARAVEIGRAIVGRALAPGQASWFTIHYLPELRRSRVEFGSSALFDGDPGIGIFLAALARSGDDAAWSDLAASALAPAVKPARPGTSSNLGGAAGAGSAIYALVSAARLLGRPDLLACARARADELDSAAAASAPADILHGTAGALLALLALHRATGDPRPLARAHALGESLLAARRPDPRTGCRTWPAAESALELGFAHGTSGTAYALLRLAETLSEAGEQPSLRVAPVSDFAAAAVEALQHVSLCDPALRTLARLERRAGWAHGATGHALALLAAVSQPAASGLEERLERTLAIVERQLLLGSDTLCSGRMGRVEVLLLAGSRLGRPELVRRALEGSAPRRVAPGYTTGWGRGCQEVGLYRGLAGIGYELLRLARVPGVPSLLAWD